MKKALSLILALIMALSLSVTAFAEENDKSGTTDITATKAAPFSYKIVIPESVTGITAAGVYQVGQAKVENVVSATEKTVISYTATTTDFKLSTDESKTMAATYHTEEAATNAFPTTAVKVYEKNADVASIPTMWVKIAESDWNAAAAGTYTATVTYNFSAEEVKTPVEWRVRGCFESILENTIELYAGDSWADAIAANTGKTITVVHNENEFYIYELNIGDGGKMTSMFTNDYGGYDCFLKPETGELNLDEPIPEVLYIGY